MSVEEYNRILLDYFMSLERRNRMTPVLSNKLNEWFWEFQRKEG